MRTVLFSFLLFMTSVQSGPLLAQDFWEQLHGPPPADILTAVEDLVVRGEDTVLACLENGFAVSFDRGQTWRRRTNGLSPNSVGAMATDSNSLSGASTAVRGLGRPSLDEAWERPSDASPRSTTAIRLRRSSTSS